MTEHVLSFKFGKIGYCCGSWIIKGLYLTKLNTRSQFVDQRKGIKYSKTYDESSRSKHISTNLQIRNTGDDNLTNSVANNAKTRGHWIAYNENI